MHMIRILLVFKRTEQRGKRRRRIQEKMNEIKKRKRKQKNIN